MEQWGGSMGSPSAPGPALGANPFTKTALDDGRDDSKIGACMHRSGREIIQIQVGKAGCGMGHEFIRDLVEEHKIEYLNEDLRGTCTATEDEVHLEAHLDVFFNEGLPSSCRKTRYVPRCLLVDLNMQDLAQMTSGPLGHLYRPESIIGNDEGSGNCYAKAFHTEGPDLADNVLDLVRKESERCNCLQGVQFCHAIAGGTGSGLTSLLLRSLRDFLDKGSKCLMQTFTLVPGPGVSDITIEPYNAALAYQDLLEYTEQCFFFDNCALGEIVQKSMGCEVPKRQQMNNIVALCMSGLTSGLRFKGPLNADLWKMHTNLVPFKNAHFLISSFAPLHSKAAKVYRQSGSVLDLAQQMLMKDNVTVKCDPLNPGDVHNEVARARILASWASWRGNFRTQEVDRILHSMTKPGSRFDIHYPDWIPNPIASNICSQEHVEYGSSVVYVANNTAVAEVVDHTARNWDKLFSKGSYLHVFQKEGISKEDMQESRGILQYVKELYGELARREDKILDDSGGRLQINDRAIDNADHENIAQELKELMTEDMCIQMEKGRSTR